MTMLLFAEVPLRNGFIWHRRCVIVHLLVNTERILGEPSNAGNFLTICATSSFSTLLIEWHSFQIRFLVIR
jgi:hypothetical protein